jgi:hypothetical protein
MINQQKSFFYYHNIWDWTDDMASCSLFPIDSYEFELDTGLVDKFGNHVYIGDIVEYKYGKFKITKNIDIGFTCINGTNGWFGGMGIDKSHLRVIGNIHEQMK